MRNLEGRRRGGEGGIRTLEPVKVTRFPGEPDQPLQHLSAGKRGRLFGFGMVRDDRGGGEGGIRTLGAQHPPLFENGTINHSDTSPSRVYHASRLEKACSAGQRGLFESMNYRPIDPPAEPPAMAGISAMLSAV